MSEQGEEFATVNFTLNSAVIMTQSIFQSLNHFTPSKHL